MPDIICSVDKKSMTTVMVTSVSKNSFTKCLSLLFITPWSMEDAEIIENKTFYKEVIVYIFLWT